MAEAGGTIEQLKQAGGWKSESVARGYIGKSKRMRITQTDMLKPANQTDYSETNVFNNAMKTDNNNAQYNRENCPENIGTSLNNCSNVVINIYQQSRAGPTQ